MTHETPKPDIKIDPTRRDFLYLATGAMAAVGVAASVWPFLDSLRPAADIRSLASIEIDLSPLAAGQAITVIWRGKPIF
ncbi:MAG: ubiquinol-cytochrome c reductase iron-sulfur subunit N-terminal domain-containing protein, partial [Pseudomonadota bacterium]|nr:ubiquinol-cytochrome c reductase iron-sulfur subunit N-terminal domain-containing protein [Pseudomonadota bacterium]